MSPLTGIGKKCGEDAGLADRPSPLDICGLASRGEYSLHAMASVTELLH